MKWINDFKKFKKIRETFDLPPIEYAYQKYDTSKIDSIHLWNVTRLNKTANTLEKLKNLDRNKDYYVIFEDDYTGKVVKEKIILDFTDLRESIDKYTQFNLESKTHFKVYDAGDFDTFFEISENPEFPIEMKEGSVFISFEQGNGSNIIYVNNNNNPIFRGVKQKK